MLDRKKKGRGKQKSKDIEKNKERNKKEANTNKNINTVDVKCTDTNSTSEITTGQNKTCAPDENKEAGTVDQNTTASHTDSQANRPEEVASKFPSIEHVNIPPVVTQEGSKKGKGRRKKYVTKKKVGKKKVAKNDEDSDPEFEIPLSKLQMVQLSTENISGSEPTDSIDLLKGLSSELSDTIQLKEVKIQKLPPRKKRQGTNRELELGDGEACEEEYDDSENDTSYCPKKTDLNTSDSEDIPMFIDSDSSGDDLDVFTCNSK
jgi:hypothetical protein